MTNTSDTAADMQDLQLIKHLTKNVRKVTERFDTLLEMGEPSGILSTQMLQLMLKDITLEDVEYSTLTSWVSNKLKSLGVVKTTLDVEFALRRQQTFDLDWEGMGDVVFESNGRIMVNKTYTQGRQQKNRSEYITNFILVPKYLTRVDKVDLQERYYTYTLIVDNNISDPYTLRLTSDAFDSMDSFREQLKKQVGHSGATIHDAKNHMKGLHHLYVTLANFQEEKKGTTILGYERLGTKHNDHNDGDKFFCTPTGEVYDLKGEISDKYEYVGKYSRQIDRSEVDQYTHLTYEKKKWEKEVMPFVLKNIMKLHTKENMLLILGWLGCIPHEFNVRKVNAILPILHLAGKQGAGKSTIIEVLHQYLGKDSETLGFYATPAATRKMLTNGYTMITTLDEYGGSEKAHGWDKKTYEQMHTLMKKVVRKGTHKLLGGGDGGQENNDYKLRNCVISFGQNFIQDTSIATRSLQLYIYESFQQSDRGKTAKRTLSKFSEFEDKNFWTGFCLWNMRQPDVRVKKVLKKMLRAVELSHPKMKSRQKSVASTVMTGLYYVLKMAKEHDLVTHKHNAIGFSYSDIFQVPEIMQNIVDIANGGEEDSDILTDFLKDLGGYAQSQGNMHGNYFGDGYAVREFTPTSNLPGKYGNNKEAAVFGQECIAINMDTMVTAVNSYIKSNKYSVKDLTPIIRSHFEDSCNTNGDGLVLAPNGYNIKHKGAVSKYTLFSKEKFVSIAGGLNVRFWAQNG